MLHFEAIFSRCLLEIELDTFEPLHLPYDIPLNLDTCLMMGYKHYLPVVQTVQYPGNKLFQDFECHFSSALLQKCCFMLFYRI